MVRWASGGGLGAARPTHLQGCAKQTGGVEPRPYAEHESWCKRADVGIGPYGGCL